MRSMITVLLLATATVAQPEPLLGGITDNLISDGSHFINKAANLLEGLLDRNGLLGPLPGGLVGGAGGLLGGGVGQVGDLVTCVLSQLLGQVGGLLDQILGPVLGALGLQGSPIGSIVDQLRNALKSGLATVTDVIKALASGGIKLADVAKLIRDNVLKVADVVELIVKEAVGDEAFIQFIKDGIIGADVIVDLLLEGELSPQDFDALVTDGTIDADLSLKVQAALAAKIGAQFLAELEALSG